VDKDIVNPLIPTRIDDAIDNRSIPASVCDRLNPDVASQGRDFNQFGILCESEYL